MSRYVKEFVEIGEGGSLDELIASLLALRESLPEAGAADVRMRGDDVFGRRISISFLRPLSEEEAACEARYATGARDLLDRAA